MKREDLLADALTALAPVKDLLQHARMGVAKEFNPLVMQYSLDFARVNTLLALAMDDADLAAVLEALQGGSGVQVRPQPTPGSRLVVPG